jgi:hypothetical protein
MSKSDLNTRRDSGERLLRSFGDGEEVVVRAEARAGHLLDVHRNERLPHGIGGIGLCEVHALGGADVRQEIALGLLILFSPSLELGVIIALSSVVV